MRTWGFYLVGGDLSAATNRRLQALATALLASAPAGITDVVPGYTNLYVEHLLHGVEPTALRAWLRAAVGSLPGEGGLPREAGGPRQGALGGHRPGAGGQPPGVGGQPSGASGGREVTIPVRYDGEDLAAIARAVGLDREQVAERHAAVTYQVYATGFTPGFSFLGVVDPTIRVPRRAVPRPRVAAHTLAMANEQTGVYPLASPGGWSILGTALTAMYDPHRPEPFLLRAGDDVRFVPSEGETPPEPTPLLLLPAEPRWPVMRVIQAGLHDLVVDRGRFRAGRFGMGRGGPVDASLASLADRLVGNQGSGPVLEMVLAGPTLEVLRDAVVAVTGACLTALVNGEPFERHTSRAVRRGDVVSFRPNRDGCRAYLAVAGGIASDAFMGSASVDVRGRIGRPLAEGDVLGLATPRTARAGFGFVPYRPARDRQTVRLLPGPQPDPMATAALCSAPFTVVSGDRMGIVLDGPAVAGGEIMSEATPLGAVQVTSGGVPIILLHDRGTIGGYTKPAIVHPSDLGSVAQLRPGARVRFVPVQGTHGMRSIPLDEALAGDVPGSWS